MTQPFTLDFDAMFNAYVKSTETQFNVNRMLTVGASEAFNCIRQLACEKRHEEWGIEPDDEPVDWGAMQRGKLIENYHVVPAVQHGLPPEVTLEFAGSEQHTLVLERNSATPDGLFTGIPVGPVKIIAGGHVIEIPEVTAGCIGFEIKSIDPRATLEEEKKKHFGQTQIGLGLMRQKTQWAPDHWLILYVDASFLSKMTPFLINYQPNVFKSAQRIAKAIYERETIDDFEPEGKYTGECDNCRWKTACGDAVLTQYAQQTNDQAGKDPVVVEAVTPAIEQYIAASKAAEEADENLERAKQAVKDALLANNARKVSSDSWTMTWFTQKGKTTVDYKQLVADHDIDTEPYKRTGNGFDQLKFTPKKSTA